MIDGGLMGAALVGSLSEGMKTPIEPMLLLPTCPRWSGGGSSSRPTVM